MNDIEYKTLKEVNNYEIIRWDNGYFHGYDVYNPKTFDYKKFIRLKDAITYAKSHFHPISPKQSS